MVDLEKHINTVGRAKTPSGTGRQIPINEELLAVLVQYRTWCGMSNGSVKLNQAGIYSRLENLVWSGNWISMKMRYFATAARRSR